MYIDSKLQSSSKYSQLIHQHLLLLERHFEIWCRLLQGFSWGFSWERVSESILLWVNGLGIDVDFH